MAATQEDIVSALQKLDSGNDDMWTDDGLPRVDAVQQLANDNTLTRKMISAAAQGFSRAGTEANKEPEDILSTDPIVAQALAEDEENGFNVEEDPTRDPLTDDQVKEIMQRRVSDASTKLEQRRREVIDAQNAQRRAEANLDKVRLDMNRRFPPMHESDAIKLHLASQLRMAHERAGSSPSQIDAALGLRGKQGWARPARSVINAR